ncbi:hypothetical protein BST83_12745 [Polaribacter filamentus]|uniref:Uncharacterized protein n=1 Tax=Polaribacter filamentus TaxID=53483 RepID=A0A2S7KZ80_9FLAO|nr:hypothetical protein [Polaribacter filamentus]PQB07920.1 hypothetical protein BST83_12745 [Polaribacter filamentus]
MLGLLVIIVVSWLLLHFIENESIDVLGINPNGKRFVEFIVGFLFIILITLLTIYIESVLLSVDWKMKKRVKLQLVF